MKLIIHENLIEEEIKEAKSSSKSDSQNNDNNNNFSIESIQDVLKNTWRVMINFLILYIFKYISISALADRSTMRLKNSENLLERNAFILI